MIDQPYTRGEFEWRRGLLQALRGALELPETSNTVVRLMATIEARDSLLREVADAWVQVYGRLGLDPAEPTGSVERMRRAFVKIEAALEVKP